MHKHLQTLLFVFLSLLAIGCSSQPHSGRTWKLHQIEVWSENDLNWSADVSGVALITIKIDDDQLRADTGCHVVYAKFNNQNDTPMTQFAVEPTRCEHSLTLQQQELANSALAILENTAYVHQDNAQLTLWDGQRNMLRFWEIGAVDHDHILRNTAWQLTEMVDEMGQQHPIIAETTAHFEPAELSGIGGCNQYQFEYTVENLSLNINRKANVQHVESCGVNVSQHEDIFFRLLSQVEQFAPPENQTLTLLLNGTGHLTFERALQPTLENITWEVAYHRPNTTTIKATRPPITQTLLFQDGQLTGSTGCGEFMARYILNQMDIVITNVEIVSARCTEEDDIWIMQLLTSLESAESILINRANTLVIEHASGQLNFIPR